MIEVIELLYIITYTGNVREHIAKMNLNNIFNIF